MGKKTYPSDYINVWFGRLTPIGFSEKKKHWTFRCECGTVKSIDRGSVFCGDVQSCGCLRVEACIARQTHGQTKKAKLSPTYMSWRSMMARCYRPYNNRYPSHGGRGIIVCDRWRISFQAFRDDMGERPSKSHTIDRIDNNGNYTPENCRWATKSQQARNRRSTVRIEVDGSEMLLVDAAEKFGLTYSALHSRIFYHGWSIERAISEPMRPTK